MASSFFFPFPIITQTLPIVFDHKDCPPQTFSSEGYISLPFRSYTIDSSVKESTFYSSVYMLYVLHT